MKSSWICLLAIGCHGQEAAVDDARAEVSSAGDVSAADAAEFPRRNHDAAAFADHELPIVGEYRPTSGVPCTLSGGCGKSASCDPYSGWCCDGFAVDDVTGECMCGYGLGCSADPSIHCCVTNGSSVYMCLTTDSSTCPVIDP